MPETAGRKNHAAVEKARALITESWQSQANLSFFLLLLVVLGFVLPSLGFGRDERLYSDFGFSLLLVSGMAIAWGRPKLLLLAGFVGSATLAVRWMAFFTPTPTLQLWAAGWSLASILVIEVVLLLEVFRRGGPVTLVRIQGAIAIYMLFGIGWAHAYHITELVHPGSFNSAGGTMSNVGDWVYFSFVTLSTLGYGDIVPVRPIARSLAIAEALTGQLFLAITIARLVAMEVISWQAKANQDSQ